VGLKICTIHCSVISVETVLFPRHFTPCRRFWSVIFMFCNFLSCTLVRLFHVLHFQSTRSQPHPKPAITIISGTSKATDYKFGRYIHRLHPNTSHEKFWRKGSVGVSRDGPNFLSTPIISGMGKATNFKFGRYIHRVHANKSPLKIWNKWSLGVSRDCPNFLSTPYYLRNG